MKLFVLTKKSLLLYTGLFLFVICFVSLNFDKTVDVFKNSIKRDLPIYCVDKDQKICAMSFDAAWGAEDTPVLIKILDDYDVKTTFFVVGDWVDKYPDAVKALSDAGHEIMNHSDTHPHMTSLTKEKMIKEVTHCNNKIKSITGVEPILFRPPYGDYNNDVVSNLRELGMYTIQWDVDSLDWKDLSPQAITERVTSKVKPGSIILFHNAAKNTPEALPMILEYLKQNEYKIVPVSQIIYKDNFTIDTQGKQISNKVTVLE